MFGFLFGMACLAGLYFYMGGKLPDRPGGPGGFERRMAQRHLFSSLETTPGQERVIKEAMEEVRAEANQLRDAGRQLRTQLGALLREESLSAAQVEELLASHESSLDGLRGAFIKSLTQVHEALEPSQRTRLAELITSFGSQRSGGCGHHHGPRGMGWA